MMHKPIQIQNLSLSFSHKICFEHFNAQVIYGQHIAIIGRNGSGKTSFLNVLQGIVECSCGDIKGLDNLKMGFVPQSTYLEKNALSGAQHFNAALTSALSLNPDIFLLDEPTNHLDKHNRKTLMRYLKSYTGAFIVISHDTELLRHCVDTFWHIDNHEIKVFSGDNRMGGEWGHSPLPPDEEEGLPPPACYCGRSGCVETWLSGPALSLDHRRHHGESLTAEAVGARAGAGDVAANASLQRYERRLAKALAQVINILDPDVIALGGGLSNLERLYRSVPMLWTAHVFSDEVRTRLRPNVHGDSSGVRGAAWLWDEA